MIFLRSLVVVHLACMATWFGMTLSHPRRLRLALGATPEAARTSVDALMREVRLAVLFAGLTLVSGVALMMVEGPANMRPYTNFGAAFGVIAFLLFRVAEMPNLTRIQRAVYSNTPASELRPWVGRVQMFSGMTQLCWLIALTLMAWR